MIAKLEMFVRHLVENESFRETAQRDPEGAVALFGLLGPEREGALKLCAQMSGPTDGVRNGSWI